MNAETPQSQDRVLDVTSLRALTHPLRIQLLEALSQFGPQTASALAGRLGESSGATSYHLRQLAKHDLVREIEGRGSARERWWERPPGALSIHSKELADDPATKDALRMVNREFGHNRAQLLEDFMEHGDSLLPAEWLEGSVISTMSTRLTAVELTELSDELNRHARELFETYRHRNDNNPDARAVQVHINAFPILRGQFPAPATTEREARK